MSTYGWELGSNLGPKDGVVERCKDRVRQLRRKHRKRVSLIGWSLGGIYARELAKELARDVRQVITLGTPFTGHPKATNAWRLYELVTGHRIGAPQIHEPLRVPPPVPDHVYLQPHRWRCRLAVQRRARGLAHGQHRGRSESLRNRTQPARVVRNRRPTRAGRWHSGGRSSAAACCAGCTAIRLARPVLAMVRADAAGRSQRADARLRGIWRLSSAPGFAADHGTGHAGGSAGRMPSSTAAADGLRVIRLRQPRLRPLVASCAPRACRTCSWLQSREHCCDCRCARPIPSTTWRSMQSR